MLEAFAVFAVALGGYLANGRTIGSGDTLPNRYLPIAIVRDHTLALDGFPFLHDSPDAYWAVRDRGRWLSFYPVSAAILAVPVYLPALLAGEPSGSALWETLEKRAAAVLVALSAAIFFAAVRRVTTPGTALLATLAYAFGSSNLSVASQGLWQHGPAELGLCAALYCFVRGREDERWIARAGLPLALAVVSRPNAVPLAVPLGVLVVLRHPRSLPKFVAFALPPLVFHLAYNVHYHGDPLWSQFPPFHGFRWWGKPARTIPGLLVSPGRGLFVYSPIFVFSAAAMIVAWRRGGDELLRALSIGMLLGLALLAPWSNWWGGATYGPRLLCDFVPFLAFALHPWSQRLGENAPARIALALALLASVAAHAVGAFWDDGSWNAGPPFVDRAPHRLWSWTDNALVNPGATRASHAWARARGIPIPVDPAVDEELRRAIAERPWTDRAIRARRALAIDARDEATIADLDRLLADRFEPDLDVEWDFGGSLVLRGIRVRPVGPDALEITYLWRAAERMDRAYFAAVHLEAGDASVLQDDHALGPTDYDTSRWLLGESIAETRTIVLPGAPPAGGWELRVGVWCPADRSTLSIRDGWFHRRKLGTLLRIARAPDGALRVMRAAASP